MGTNLKSKGAYTLICVFCMYLMAMALLSSIDIQKNKELISKDAYFVTHKYKTQVALYAERVMNLYDYEKNQKQGTVLVDNDTSLKAVKEYVQMEQSMKYYFKNKNTGEIYSNINESYDIEKYTRDNSIHMEKFPKDIGTNWEFENINYFFHKSGIQGTILFVENNDNYSQIKKDYVYYNSIRNRLIKEIKVGFMCILVGILSLLCARKIFKDKGGYINITKRYENIPLDLRVIIFLIYYLLMKSYLKGVEFFYKPINISHFKILTITTFGVMFFVMNLKHFSMIIFHKEIRKSKWKGSLIHKVRELKYRGVLSKGILKREIIIATLTMIFGMSLVLSIYGIIVSFTPIVLITSIYNLIYLVFIPKRIFERIHAISSIVMGTDDIVSGKLESHIEPLQNVEFAHISENINSMKQIYKESMESQVKSERLKTELITNVSHDLKTPLTSIINYIKLLKSPTITEDERKKYLEVLDKKSQRLKILIEDLFEAAKASSGSMKLNIEKIDVAMLLNQALGEFEDKIKISALTFRTDIPVEPLYANLDGQRTWRVFENIIGNALKYSQSDSRVYMDMVSCEDDVIITVKNMAAYEMNFEVCEIFERFRRGDKARSTEGSGLGLSIAKNLVELQGGRMNIEIDGDLFKVIIRFPLIKG